MKPILKIFFFILLAGNCISAFSQYDFKSVKHTLYITVDVEKFDPIDRSLRSHQQFQWESMFPSAIHHWGDIEEAELHSWPNHFGYAGRGLGGSNYFFDYDSINGILHVTFANPMTHFPIGKFKIPFHPSQKSVLQVKKVYLIEDYDSPEGMSNSYAAIHYVYGKINGREVYKTILISHHGKWVNTGGYRAEAVFKYDFPQFSFMHPLMFMDVNVDGWIDYIQITMKGKIPVIQIFEGDEKSNFIESKDYRIEFTPVYPNWVIHSKKGAMLCKLVLT